jgi:hypothetical protein
MRIGVKPGQLGPSIDDLRRCWAEAEEAGFESFWTFDHLTGSPCHEPVALLAARAVSTRRVRLGCPVLIPSSWSRRSNRGPSTGWPAIPNCDRPASDALTLASDRQRLGQSVADGRPDRRTTSSR